MLFQKWNVLIELINVNLNIYFINQQKSIKIKINFNQIYSVLK